MGDKTGYELFKRVSLIKIGCSKQSLKKTHRKLLVYQTQKNVVENYILATKCIHFIRVIRLRWISFN